jgi:hypothetical protein
MNYEDLVRSQPKISNQDFEPLVVKDVLLPEHILEIYETILALPEEKTRVQPWAGHKIWDTRFSKNLEDRISFIAQSALGEDIKLNYDYSFARYSRKFGYECKLFPHYDTRDSQRITFDIQLRASEPWALVVENKKFLLENNQALIFAGTQQIHWRENIQISQDAEIDMLFCHLEYTNSKPLDEDQEAVLRDRANFLIKESGIGNEVVVNEV